jgi:hypothetical protein
MMVYWAGFNPRTLLSKQRICYPLPFSYLHLLASAVLITIIALVYGFAPQKLVPALGNFQIGSHNVQNFFKAIMGLYFGTAAYWALGPGARPTGGALPRSTFR